MKSLKNLFIACGLVSVIVPAKATTIDLTTPDSSGGFIGGALFQKSGSGVPSGASLDPFLTLQQQDGLTVERGFNTSANVTMNTVLNSGTRDLRLSEVPL